MRPHCTAMAAVAMRAWVGIRSRPRALVLLILLIGLGGGASLAALAGARRSENALPRYLDRWSVNDAGVFVAAPTAEGTDFRNDGAAQLQAIQRFPEVARVVRVTDAIIGVADATSPSGWQPQLGVIVLDGKLVDATGVPTVLAGELPSPDDPLAVVVNEEMAARRHLRVGSTLHIAPYTAAQSVPAGNDAPIAPKGPPANMNVAAIVRLPNDLEPPLTGNDGFSFVQSTMYLGPGYWKQFGPDIARYATVAAVQLKNGTRDVDALRADIRRAAGDDVEVHTTDLNPGYAATGLPFVRRAIHVESAALLALGLLAALAAIVTVGLTLARDMASGLRDAPILRALGFTRGELIRISAIEGGVIGVGGAIVAVAVAIALSPLTPIGLARRAETSPGIHVDALVLTVGALAIVLLSVAGAVLGARRATRVHTRLRRTALLSRVGIQPVSPTFGARMALAPSGDRRSGGAGTVAALVAATAAVIAASVFATSIDAASRDPRSYGVTWDVSVGNYADDAAARAGAAALARDPDVESFVGSSTAVAIINGKRVEVAIVHPGRGDVPPVVLEGAAPRAADEIALGSATLDSIGAHIGDTVKVGREGRPLLTDLRVVGRVMVAAPGDPAIEPAKGALAQSVAGNALATPTDRTGPSQFLVRFRPGVDRAAALEQLRREFFGTIAEPLPIQSVRDTQRVAHLPAILAAVMAVLAAGALVHALVVTTRDRRRDLAMLKALGLRRGATGATIEWAALSFAMLAVVIGLPVGVLVGRFAWHLTADQLGLVLDPRLNAAAIALTAVALVGVAVFAAALPAWRVARLGPARALHDE